MAATAETPDVVPVAEGPIVLYDGVCGLCAKSVRWILRHERADVPPAIRFAPLQGPTAAALRARYPNIPQTLESVIYIDGDRAYLRSKAFLHLAKHLRRPWRWVHAMRWLPSFALDIWYRLIAGTRYRMFGKVDACELPSPAHRGRFLT